MTFLMLLIPYARANHHPLLGKLRERLSEAMDLISTNTTILIEKGNPLCASMPRILNAAIQPTCDATAVLI